MKQISKILTLGILFLFVCTLQLTAQKCKFEINRTDPITGEATKGNSFWISKGGQGFTVAPPVKMGFNRAGDSFFVGMFIRYHGNMREVIQKGDPIAFKLSNGEVVTIRSQDDFLPTAHAAQVVVSTYQAIYDIDAATLQKIADNPPTYIRISIGNKVYEKELPAKTGKQIADAARCILL
jgi:hypothetical protein